MRAGLPELAVARAVTASLRAQVVPQGPVVVRVAPHELQEQVAERVQPDEPQGRHAEQVAPTGPQEQVAVRVAPGGLQERDALREPERDALLASGE